jgi:TRAP-type C4-dicarboxylate transport system substrate-binding protein
VDDLTVEAREWSVNMLREKEVEAKNFLAAQGVTFISPTPEEVTQMKSSIPAAKAYAIKLGVEKGARADDIEAVWASAGKVAQRLMGK